MDVNLEYDKGCDNDKVKVKGKEMVMVLITHNFILHVCVSACS